MIKTTMDSLAFRSLRQSTRMDAMDQIDRHITTTKEAGIKANLLLHL